jgi:toluene monooxygenase system ferredoxin subunit
VDGQCLVVGNDAGDLFALTGWCSHEGSALAMGEVHGGVLTCFAHRWTYSVKTGDPVWPPLARVAPGYRLRRHEVKAVDGSVLVARRPGRLSLG